MKHLLFYLFLLIGLSGMARSPESEANIPLNGNAYITSVERQARITDPEGRKDYQGGLARKDGFYLKNGGFFDGPTSYGMIFMLHENHVQPEIDFTGLEKLSSRIFLYFGKDFVFMLLNSDQIYK